MNEELTPLYKEGWVCPKCGAVMSPNTPTCLYCVPNEPNTANITGAFDDNTAKKVYDKLLDWQFKNLAANFGKTVK